MARGIEADPQFLDAKGALLGGLDARATRIAKDLDEAASLRAQAEKLQHFEPHLLGCRVTLEVPHRHGHVGAPRVRVSLTARAISAGVYNTSYVQCTSGCPVSTANAQTVNLNTIDGTKTFDLNLNYTFENLGTTVFFVVDNVFNVLQPLKYGTTSAGYYQNTNADEGRTFRLGVRFKM